MIEQFDCLPVDEVGLMLGVKKTREYPTFEVRRGELSKKKIQYENSTEETFDLRVESNRTDVCTVRDHEMQIEAGKTDFIRLRILVPNNVRDNALQFQVTVYNNNIIYEILNFTVIVVT